MLFRPKQNQSMTFQPMPFSKLMKFDLHAFLYLCRYRLPFLLDSIHEAHINFYTDQTKRFNLESLK